MNRFISTANSLPFVGAALEHVDQLEFLVFVEKKPGHFPSSAYSKRRVNPKKTERRFRGACRTRALAAPTTAGLSHFERTDLTVPRERKENDKNYRSTETLKLPTLLRDMSIVYPAYISAQTGT